MASDPEGEDREMEWQSPVEVNLIACRFHRKSDLANNDFRACQTQIYAVTLAAAFFVN